jgi:ribose transport system permease protein
MKRCMSEERPIAGTTTIVDVPPTWEDKRSAKPTASEPASTARGRPGLGWTSRFTGLLFLAVIIAVFAIWIPSSFLTGDTVKGIASQQAVTLVLAIGLLFTLAAGQFDLSVAQNLGLTSLLCATLMVYDHMAPGLAVAITLVVGAAIGAANGFLVAVVGVNSFIATLGMSSVLLAINEQISNSQFVGPLPNSFQGLTSHSVFGIPEIAIYSVVVALIAWYALEHTPWGRRMYATGAGSDAARLAGVRTPRYVFVSFVVSGVVAALAGVMLASQLGDLSPSLGPAYLLPVFAACFLGTTQVKVGRFNVWGTVTAIVLLATGEKGLQLADGGQLWVTDLFNGLALIGAVSTAVLAGRWRRAKS